MIHIIKQRFSGLNNLDKDVFEQAYVFLDELDELDTLKKSE